MKTITTSYWSLIVLFLLINSSVFAQFKPYLENIKKNEGPPHSLETLSFRPFEPGLPVASRPFASPGYSYRNIPKMMLTKGNTVNTIRLQYADRSGIPAAIYGETAEAAAYTDPEEKIFAQLQALKKYLQIEDPDEEFHISKISEGANGYTHYLLRQFYRDVPVYGGELTVHLQNGVIQMLNGRSFPTPKISRVIAAMSKENAEQRAMTEVQKISTVQEMSASTREILGLDQSSAELILYHPAQQADQVRLVWRVEVVPNIHHREVYFLDAHTGDVIFQQNVLCKAHADLPPTGPATGSASDLLGQNRTVHSYEIDGTFALIDASRPMFNPNISFDPGDPANVIWTLDAEDETPIENDDFSVAQILSDNKNVWPANAVSAHYNAGQAYEYYRTTFGRNSINGRGGTIVSIINVADEDGSGLANAFWSGSAMFYGNGGNVFDELPKALDVAGHEMSHGVVQTTANLEYLSQSGALNESFADIFGAMIDRDNWQIGEDVVKTNFFPSGALRDMSDPHNGPNNPNTNNGWQPAHMNEYQNLPETEDGDNGGVHVNSGIPNRAYYLFATEVGKDVAEQVYYNALANYLTRFSQFIDLRIAVLASAAEKYNNTVVAAAAAAFDQVGIVGDQGTEQPDDLEVNEGTELVLTTNTGKTALSLFNTDGSTLAESFLTGGVANKPSISDDGTLMIYIDGDQHIQLISFNWSTSQYGITQLSNEGVWRTAAISKDGQLLAALTDDYDDQLYIIRLADGMGVRYTLTNPTTAEGVSTGTVSYADVLEWSLDGQYVMYDALSSISKVDGTIEFWDIGIIEVWDNQSDDFGSGYITKLFTGLEEGISVGNPTFAKNSPYIIAFDFLDDNQGTYTVKAGDVLTGKVKDIFEAGDLGFPNFTVQDDALSFDAYDQDGNRVLGITDLANDKITPTSNAFIYISSDNGVRWGLNFATGERNLTTDTKDLVLQAEGLKLYPNPVREQLQMELELPASDQVLIQVFDQLGHNVYSEQQSLGSGLQKISLDLGNLSGGTYVLDIRQGNRQWIQRMVKL
ncbi:MAG: M4 family metallopeptidase [Lewinella sp.]|nr:M4 family metallopeptidase [Lewinella sp.]